jgi:hypothetical protein
MKSSAPTLNAPARKLRRRSSRPPMSNRDWLTTTEVGQLIGCCRATVVRMCSDGKFGVSLVGKADRRISKQAIRDYYAAINATPPFELSPAARITLGCNPIGDLLPVHWFYLTLVLRVRTVTHAVIGTDDGLWIAIEAAKAIRLESPAVQMALLLSEDQQQDDTDNLFAAILKQPTTTQAILAALAETNV